MTYLHIKKSLQGHDLPASKKYNPRENIRIYINRRGHVSVDNADKSPCKVRHPQQSLLQNNGLPTHERTEI